MTGRHPFKQTPRGTRSHAIIEHYLKNFGAGSASWRPRPGYPSSSSTPGATPRPRSRLRRASM